METFKIENLTFTYPERTFPAITDVSLSVHKGDFFVLCGHSGCGKSTLLRQLKPSIAPHGRLSGRIEFCGTPLPELGPDVAVSRIGFVLQSPESQVVTDKVWHELAFGLESLGCDDRTIRRRCAEMAAFFGIENWYYKNVSELSGGQKQLLCLASVMTMQPEVLILDEPTAQLDPIAASEFLSMLGKINRELGVTILLSEHRLEEALALASRAAIMENGRILCCDTVDGLGQYLRKSDNSMFAAMPCAMRVWGSVDSIAPCPITVNDGRAFLDSYLKSHARRPLRRSARRAAGGDVMIDVSNAWFRYDKELPDVVRGLELSVKTGELLCILGGNGSGKTTTLRLIGGIKKPYRGEVRTNGRVGLLPQDPQTVFVKKTVYEDLLDALRLRGVPRALQDGELERVTTLCNVSEILDRHPYDLSGGEQQRAALAKVLLLAPDILLLDEPTKGLDIPFKEELAEILQRLKNSGACIVMVSHDVEFCAKYADRCGLFFDGSLVTVSEPEQFFTGNSFYTTAANRMARGVEPCAITAEDVMQVIGGKSPQSAQVTRREQVTESTLTAEIAQVTESTQTTENAQVTESTRTTKSTQVTESTRSSKSAQPMKSAPRLVRTTVTVKDGRRLPLWRKLGAAVSALLALVMFIYTSKTGKLSEMISSDGMTALGAEQLILYGIIIVLLVIAALFLGKRSKPSVHIQTPVERRRLGKRTVLATVLILLLIPITLFVGLIYIDRKQYYITALAVLIECMLPFFLVFEGRKPKARELVTIATLCAMAIAGRAAFFMLPQFKPVMALAIIAGVAFGGETGFLVGAVTMLVSNILFSQGPWTPWQMFAMGIIGYLAGILYKKGLLMRTRTSLCVFGMICAFVIYGGIMNPASALIWGSETLNWSILLANYVTGFPMDAVHAAATALFLWFGAEPMLEKLDRIKTKYGLVE